MKAILSLQAADSCFLHNPLTIRNIRQIAAIEIIRINNNSYELFLCMQGYYAINLVFFSLLLLCCFCLPSCGHLREGREGRREGRGGWGGRGGGRGEEEDGERREREGRGGNWRESRRGRWGEGKRRRRVKVDRRELEGQGGVETRGIKVRWEIRRRG